MALGDSFRIGDQFVDIGEVGMLLGVDEVRDQKPRPGVAGLRIGDQKYIVRKNPQIAAGIM